MNKQTVEKIKAFVMSVLLFVSFVGMVHAAPEIGKVAIEAGLIEAPSNYEIYKDL